MSPRRAGNDRGWPGPSPPAGRVGRGASRGRRSRTSHHPRGTPVASAHVGHLDVRGRMNDDVPTPRPGAARVLEHRQQEEVLEPGRPEIAPDVEPFPGLGQEHVRTLVHLAEAPEVLGFGGLQPEPLVIGHVECNDPARAVAAIDDEDGVELAEAVGSHSGSSRPGEWRNRTSDTFPGASGHQAWTARSARRRSAARSPNRLNARASDDRRSAHSRWWSMLCSRSTRAIRRLAASRAASVRRLAPVLRP